MATTPGPSPQKLSLHDAVAIGDLELGLAAENRPSVEEINRLPLLLRLLSVARPLSSIPSFPPVAAADSDKKAHVDALANEVVACLEDVAATYSTAEGVDVVTCHLAPSICRKISRLSPLKRKKNGASFSHHSKEEWLTSDLVTTTAQLGSSPKRQRTTSPEKNRMGSRPTPADDLNEEEDDDDDDRYEDDQDHHSDKKSSTSQMQRIMLATEEDSQEATVKKTLSDLCTLVVNSLRPFNLDEERDGANTTERLSLSLDNSILADALQGSAGVTGASDLGSTVAALMHYAPVLRHEHVATALCRATMPRSSDMIKLLASNCPSAVPSLLRGCVSAFKHANDATVGCRDTAISNTSKSAVRALASLSSREALRVLTTLQQDNLMHDVQLHLALEYDPICVTNFVQHYLAYDEDFSSTDCQGQSPQTHYVVGETTTAAPRFRNGLAIILFDDSTLMVKTLDFVEREISNEKDYRSLERTSWTRTCTLLTCYNIILFKVELEKQIQNTPACAKAVNNLVNQIQNLFHEIKTLAAAAAAASTTGSVPDKTSSLDQAHSLLLCSSVMSFFRLSKTKHQEPSMDDVQQKCLQALWQLPQLSLKCNVMAARCAHAIRHGKSYSMCKLICEILQEKVVGPDDSFVKEMEDVLSLLSEGASSQKMDFYSIVSRTYTDESLSIYPNEVFACLPPTNLRDQSIHEKIEATLKNILCECDSCSSAITNKIIPEFICKAVGFLSEGKTNVFPLVSTVGLERLGSKVDMNQAPATLLQSNLACQFFLQLLYWLEYIDQTSTTLTTFDARCLPICRVLSLCNSLSSHGHAGALFTRIQRLLELHFPDVVVHSTRWSAVTDSYIDDLSRSPKQSARKIRNKLSSSLRACVHGSTKNDSNGMEAERVFFFARQFLSESDLFTTTVSALLSEPNAPAPYIPYSLLCRDPMVLVGCSMRIWQCRGLRHCLLYTLSTLLEANEVIVFKAAPSHDVATSLIVSRNVLLAHSLLAAVTGTADTQKSRDLRCCSMITNMLRMLIASNRGLMGILVKQGLPDPALDWLVDYVPETMNDSKSLMNVLSEKGALSASEKLTAAGAVLRIAVAHGHGNEVSTQALAYVALAQLVASFFLIVGPVGVPVEALVGDGSGLDVAQASRTVCFRMLRALNHVRGGRVRLRKESGMALQKLAGLCKGESISTGVAGSVANRRNLLLKEIFDAVVKVANSMGSGIALTVIT